MKKQIVKIEKYIYTVVYTSHDCYEEDSVSLFHFNSLKDARKWMKKDMEWNIKSRGDDFVFEEETYNPNNGYLAIGSEWMSWEIRKLPIFIDGTWTDPHFPVTMTTRPQPRRNAPLPSR